MDVYRNVSKICTNGSLQCKSVWMNACLCVLYVIICFVKTFGLHSYLNLENGWNQLYRRLHKYINFKKRLTNLSSGVCGCTQLYNYIRLETKVKVYSTSSAPTLLEQGQQLGQHHSGHRQQRGRSVLGGTVAAVRGARLAELRPDVGRRRDAVAGVTRSVDVLPEARTRHHRFVVDCKHIIDSILEIRELGCWCLTFSDAH